MSKVRAAPKSLFRRGARRPLDEIERWPAPRERLEEALSSITAAAVRAENDATLERGREYAETIRRRTADLRRACDESRDPVRSALAALKLAEAWMQLRADALFARSVRAREASLARFPWQSAVSDDEIRTALRTYATQAEAAQALGIEARQIRNRIPLAERKAIAKYKKR